MKQFEYEWTRKSIGGAIATIMGTAGMYFAGRLFKLFSSGYWI